MSESDASLALARHACLRLRHRRRATLPADGGEALVLTLLQALASGDEGAVGVLLDPDITVVVDGGGRVVAPAKPVCGTADAARVLVELLAAVPHAVATPQSVNGQAGLVFRADDRVIGVLSLDARAGTILDIWVVLNPDKLRSWNAPDEMSASPVTNTVTPLSELVNRVVPNTPGQQEGRS